MMIQQKVKVVEEATESAPVCTHHWVIEAARGPVSQGHCRLCDETKEFKNYIDNPEEGDQPSPVFA